ncbi:uncharacterized protein LOC144872512 [Branchiostoma floridae x Branchiostoma japonicum]
MVIPCYTGWYSGRYGQTLARFVPCLNGIHHRDISSYLYEHGHQLTDTDRRMLQDGITLHLSHPAWVWKDAETTVYLSDMPVVFYSGYGTNKFVVYQDVGNNPTHAVEEKGWWLWLRDGLISVWGSIADAARAVAGYVTSVPRIVAGYVSGASNRPAIAASA